MNKRLTYVILAGAILFGLDTYVRIAHPVPIVCIRPALERTADNARSAVPRSCLR